MYAKIGTHGQKHLGAIHQLKQLCWQHGAELVRFGALYRLAEASACYLQVPVPP
jgi:hypothetical protein